MNEEERMNSMKTVITSLIGFYLLADDIYLNGMEEHFLENHLVWGGAVICLVLAIGISLLLILYLR